jgi:hypothetical protein
MKHSSFDLSQWDKLNSNSSAFLYIIDGKIYDKMST